MRQMMTWLMALIMVLMTGTGLADEPQPTAPKAPPPSSEQLAVDWMLDFMVRHAPPGRKTFYAEAQETKDEALKRYRSIAVDTVSVVYDPQNPPLFRGKNGRARTLTILAALMLHESGFMKNVDFGTGKFGRGDNGRSWCLLQLHVGKGRMWSNAGGWNTKFNRPWRYGDKKADLVKGASGPEMVADRRLCITEGLRAVRLSFSACKTRSADQRLNAYASGSCDKGASASRARMRTAQRFWSESPELRKQFVDQDVISAIQTRKAKVEAERIAAEEKSVGAPGPVAARAAE